MREVGVYDAKTQLTKLLDDVEHGETITITRHGKPVAKLVPVGKPRMSVDEAIEGILEARKGRMLGGMTTKELIEEGRKY